MKFGITMFPTDYAIGPGELAREVEAHGFESLFFPEHTHIPASRKSPWPGGPDLPTGVLAHAGPVRGADGCGRFHGAAAGGKRHLPRYRT